MKISRKFGTKARLLGAAFLVSVAGMARDLPLPEIEKLPNGMQIAWFLQEQLPVTDFIFYFPRGFRHDPIGKTGTMALLAEVLEKGAGGKTPKQISDAIESLGASRYVSTGEDYFSVGVHGLSLDAEKLLAILSDIVLKPDFPVAEYQKEKARILERWSHRGDHAESLASLVFHRWLAYGTPYGRGSFLSEAEFRTITLEDVRKFYLQTVQPAGAIFLVIGRADRARIKAKLESIFADSRWAAVDHTSAPAKAGISAAATTVGKTAGDPRFKNFAPDEILVVDRPGVNQAQVRIGFPSLSVYSPERYALAVGNAALGETFNSRLNAVIRDQLGLTYSISSSFNYSKDFSTFTLSSFTRTETVGKMLTKVKELLATVGKGDFNAEEINKAKDVLIGGFPISTSTLSAVASRWLGGVTFDLGPGYLNEFVPKVKAVQTEEVNRAFRAAFQGKPLQIVVAGEFRDIQKNLRAAGFKKIRRLTVEDLR